MKTKLFTSTIAAGLLLTTGALAQTDRGYDADTYQDRQFQGRQAAGQDRGQSENLFQRNQQGDRVVSPDRLSSGQVMRIQRALGEAGFDVGPIDGVWGESTISALADFQDDNDLDATGQLDRSTLRELDVDIRGTQRGAGQGQRTAMTDQRQFDQDFSGGNARQQRSERRWQDQDQRSAGAGQRQFDQDFADRDFRQQRSDRNWSGSNQRSARYEGGGQGEAGWDTDRQQSDRAWDDRDQRRAMGNQDDRTRQQGRQGSFQDDQQRAGMTGQQEQQRGQQQANLFVQQNLIGQTLRSQNGQQVGEVIDLALERDGQVADLVVELQDGTTVAVPFDDVRYNRQNERLTARMSAREIRNMDEFSYGPDVAFGNNQRNGQFD